MCDNPESKTLRNNGPHLPHNFILSARQSQVLSAPALSPAQMLTVAQFGMGAGHLKGHLPHPEKGGGGEVSNSSQKA